ncbi:MAG: DUF3800 domain-containing protein [Chitinophagaceae bacterium]
MIYYLFLDESGNHGLSCIDESFPVFVLCGVICSHDQYLMLGNKFIALKEKFWSHDQVILHSSDIRKCEKEFKILFDPDIKSAFYFHLNECMCQEEYTIIASAVDKRRYIEKYGPLSEDIYELSLAFILEQTIHYLTELNEQAKQLRVIIEKRGRREDSNLLTHFHKLRDKGASTITSQHIQSLSPSIKFYKKYDNKIGLQIADLIAYPIARHIINPGKPNPAFDLIEPRIYTKEGNKKGLIILP